MLLDNFPGRIREFFFFHFLVALHHVKSFSFRDIIPIKFSSLVAKYTYVESWKAIQLANQIFGFNGWSSSVVDVTPDFVRLAFFFFLLRLVMAYRSRLRKLLAGGLLG
jgi:hypothetical protein